MARISGWQRWTRAPATHGLHKVMFQLHLWLGIGFGLYVLVISVSGSAVVLRPRFPGWFIQDQVEPVAAMQISEESLHTGLAQTYADFLVVEFVRSPRPERAVRVLLERAGQRQSRYYDQYRGKDLGSTFPWQVATMEWMTRLHDELLLGRQGVVVNGIGGVLIVLMTLSGTLIWWRGSSRWHKGLLFSLKSPRGLVWQLHCVLGIWTVPMMVVWGVTAVYFAWPEPFNVLMEWLDDDPHDFETPDGWLLLMLDLHFGRFGGTLWASIIWIFLGLLPALHFITGSVVWYRRVARPRLQQLAAGEKTEKNSWNTSM